MLKEGKRGQLEGEEEMKRDFQGSSVRAPVTHLNLSTLNCAIMQSCTIINCNAIVNDNLTYIFRLQAL